MGRQPLRGTLEELQGPQGSLSLGPWLPEADLGLLRTLGRVQMHQNFQGGRRSHKEHPRKSCFPAPSPTQPQSELELCQGATKDRVLGRVGTPRRRGRGERLPSPPIPSLSLLLHKWGQWGQHSALRVAMGGGGVRVSSQNFISDAGSRGQPCLGCHSA